MELKPNAHGYGQNTYHLVLVPKCRYRLFRYAEIKKLCKKAFYAATYKYKFKIHALEVMQDHVHLFAEFKPSFSISKVIQLFKGYSAYRILKEFPYLKDTYLRKGHFWSAGKFYRSVGNVTADTIDHYIKCSQNNWNFIDNSTIYRLQP